MAGPYRTGWAQRRTTNVANGTVDSGIEAFLGTTADVPTANGGLASTMPQASDIAFEVTAGTSYSVRWGGFLAGTFWTMATSNQAIWTCRVVRETQNGDTGALLAVSAGAASDTSTVAGSATGSWALDRTFTFTPSESGTVRLYVRARVEVTATHTAIGDMNSDAGSGFGSAAETFPTGESARDATYGLVRVGSSLSSMALTGLRTNPTQGYYGDTATATFIVGVGPSSVESSQTRTVAWLDHTGATFKSQSVAASSGTSFANSLGVNPNNAWPAANENVGIKVSLDNSALSTANSGTGLPWTHWTTIPSSPGTVTGTTDGAGNYTDVTFTGAFHADPRLQVHCHAQKSSVWPHTPPDPGSPAPFDTYPDDFYLYIISADLFYGWFAAFDMNNTGVSGITGTCHLADVTVAGPTAGGTGDHTTNLVTTGSNFLSQEAASFEGGTTDSWTQVGNAGGTLANSTAFAVDGTHCLSYLTPGGAVTFDFISATGTSGVAVTAGTQYTLSGQVRSTTARTIFARIKWYNSSGTFLSNSDGSAANDSTSAWTAYSVTATAPASAAFAAMDFNVASPGANQTFYLDAVRFTDGTGTTFLPGTSRLGWSNPLSPFQFTPSAPAGQWHWWCESATDGTSTWSRLNNYLVFDQGNADPMGNFASFASGINMVSAYRDNLYLTVSVQKQGTSSQSPDFPNPGDTALVTATPRKDVQGTGNFTTYQVDVGTAPKIKIVRWRQDTNVIEYEVGSEAGGGASMTLLADGITWGYTWTTTTAQDQDTYLALVAAQIDGGAKLNQAIFFVRRPPVAFDPISFATSLAGTVSFK